MAERILIVDDAPSNLDVLSAMLEPRGYEILIAAHGQAALTIATRARPDLILLDIMMPEVDGFAICRRLKDDATLHDIPVIFITARSDMASLVEGFRVGGCDYIVKPFREEEVLIRIENHLKIHRLTRTLMQQNCELERSAAELRRANQYLRREIARREQAEDALQKADARLSIMSDREATRWGLAALVGKSKTIGKIVEDICLLHQFVGTSVLITGESGTGKELIARAIHFGSPHAQGPFIPVNCVAIPAELMESMFFGHMRGSFTGATTDRKGYFELAHGGSLFLDEIGDMPWALQAKLLRVLEDGCITPVGASQEKRVDVRILAATNTDLQAKIAAGTFRQDLYFRLARYLVAAPPLRERREDIPLLVTHFCSMFAMEMGIDTPSFSTEALAALKAYDFPGNVRELKNVIERGLIKSGGGLVYPDHLGLPVVPVNAASVVDSAAKTTSPASALPLNLDAAENLLIQRALAQTGGNVTEAARLLGIHRTRIYRKLVQDKQV
ncbi:MAG: sigma-54-dependent transcriptional regulator [Candidatus Binatia bacterium]